MTVSMMGNKIYLILNLARQQFQNATTENEIYSVVPAENKHPLSLCCANNVKNWHFLLCFVKADMVTLQKEQ